MPLTQEWIYLLVLGYDSEWEPRTETEVLKLEHSLEQHYHEGPSPAGALLFDVFRLTLCS